MVLLPPRLFRSSFRRKPESSAFLSRHSGAAAGGTRNPAFAVVFKVQCFHSACGRAGYFLCLCKESNQRKHTPGGTLSGHPALRVREGAPGFAECTSVYMQRTG